MDNPFSQPKITYIVYFSTLYKYLESFEKFFPEDILGVSTFEVESKTIEENLKTSIQNLQTDAIENIRDMLKISQQIIN